MSALTVLVACSSDDDSQPAPVAPSADVVLETPEDTPVSGSVALDGASVGVLTLGTLGQLELAADGAFIYTPNPNVHGSDHLVLAVTRGDDTAPVDVDVTITPVNDAPTLTAPAEAATPSDRRLTVAPVAAGDVDDATLSVVVAVDVGGLTSVADAPGVSTLTIDGTIADVNAALATVAYVPTVGTSSAVITWTVRDSAGLEATATTSVQVLAPMSPPAAIADAFATTGNTALVRDAADGVLTNDVDADGAVTVTTTTVATSEGGSVTFAADGSFVYRPAVGFGGNDTFEYAIVDSDGNTASAGVTVSVVGLVWYVDQASAAATEDGRSDTPFKTILPATTAATSDSTIYVREGAYTSGGLVVPAAVQLAGSGVAVDIGASGVLAAGVAPEITVRGSDVIRLSNAVTLRGLALRGSTPLEAADVATIRVEDTTIRDANVGLATSAVRTLIVRRVDFAAATAIRVTAGLENAIQLESSVLNGNRGLSITGGTDTSKTVVDVRNSDISYVLMSPRGTLHVSFDGNTVGRLFYFVPQGRSYIRISNNRMGQTAEAGIVAGFIFPGYTSHPIDLIAVGNLFYTQHQSTSPFGPGLMGSTLCADLRNNGSPTIRLHADGGAAATVVLPGFNSATTTAQAYLDSRGNTGTLVTSNVTLTGGSPCVAPETF